MDPVTAVGLAASILQFVDVGTRLFTTGYQAYKSAKGQTNENEHIETVTADLESVTKSLEQHTRRISGALSDDDLALLGLARRCQSLAQELIAILNKVRKNSKSKTWGAVQAAISATWNREEIQNKLKRIQEIQSNINTRLLSLLRTDLAKVGGAVEGLSSTSDTRHSENIQQLETARLDILLAIQEDNKVLTDTFARISLSEASAKFDAEERHEQIMAKLSSLMKDYAAQADSVDREAKILSSLLFADIQDRHAKICPPEPRTYGWIFGEEDTDSWSTDGDDDDDNISETSYDDDDDAGEEEQEDDDVDNDNGKDDSHDHDHDDDDSDSVGFEAVRIEAERIRRIRAGEMLQTWLREESGLFYISGKAGSGKSTFMKYIADHPKTRDMLTEWAETLKRDLTVAAYFFWNAGSALQKTHEGLLRSLLFQILNQCRSLIPRVFPERWKNGNLGPLDPLFRTWTLKELSKAISRLIEDATIGDCCFCFFIDGLDEYNGEHRSLVKDIQRLSKSPYVKICVSSRPWNIFEHAFARERESQNRKLSLQDYNLSDIHQFIDSQLVKDCKFKELVQSHPQAHGLVKLIRAKASGVFLWVVLVVRELHAELDEMGTYEELKDKLKDLPPDLDSFFQHIMDGIKKPYKSCMARLLMLCMDRPVELISVHFLYENRSSPNAVHEIAGPVTADVRHLWEAEARLKVNKWCRDLLNVHNLPGTVNDVVGLSHQSGVDYLQQEHVLQQLYKLAGQAFEPQISRARLELALIKSLDDETAMLEVALYKGLSGARFFIALNSMRIPKFALLAEWALSKIRSLLEATTVDEYGRIVEAIDSACQEIWIRNGKGPHHWTVLYNIPGYRDLQMRAPQSFKMPRPKLHASLLTFGMCYYLPSRYVCNRIAAMSDENFHTQGRYLLLATLTDMFGAWGREFSRMFVVMPSITELILRRGAEVNAEIPMDYLSLEGQNVLETVKCTVWECFLAAFPDSPGDHCARLHILEMLLGAGADLHCTLPSGYVSLGDCLVSKLLLHPNHVSAKDVMKLEQLLEDYHIPVTWTTLESARSQAMEGSTLCKGAFLATCK